MHTKLLSAFLAICLVTPALAQYSTPVRVVNPSTMTIPTQPPREPVIIKGSLTAGVNVGGGIVLYYTVPSDRRLVIEHVSFNTNFITCTFTSSVGIVVSDSNATATFYTNPMPPIALPGSSTRFTRASQAMKLYSAPNTFVSARWTRTASNCAATGSVAISGYLEEDLQ